MLTGIVATSLTFLGFAAALDASPVVRYPEHGYRLEAIRRLRREEPSRPLVVVVGSSRTLFAVNPGAMGFAEKPGEPAVFNYGLTGALPVYLPMGLRRLEAAGVRPDAVVVEVFPALLNGDDPAQTTYASRGEALTALEIASVAPRARSREMFARWGRSRLDAWLSFRRYQVFTDDPERLPAAVVTQRRLAMPDRYGYFRPESAPTSAPPEVRRSMAAAARAGYEPACAHLAPGAAALGAYHDLIADCRAAGTPVALYITPESDTFRAWYTPESRARLAEFVRHFRDEIGCPVFDASSGWGEDDFIDGHHMLPDGAARFSRHFADAHLRPWFAAIFPRP